MLALRLWSVRHARGLGRAYVFLAKVAPMLAPLARPIFAWNHDVVMAWGGEGLAQLVGTQLLPNTLPSA